MKNQSKAHNSPPKRPRGRGKSNAVEVVTTEVSGDIAGQPVASALSSSSAATHEPEVGSEGPGQRGAVTQPSAVVSAATLVDVDTKSSALTAASRARAERIVQDYVPLAIGAGMIPLPGLDLAAIGGLQLKVLASLAEHYRVPFTREQAQLIVTSLLGSVGSTVLAGAALVSLAKFVPVFGTVVGLASMPVAGGVVTRALGHLAIDHFERGGTMDTFDLDVAQAAFLRKIAEAKAALA